MTSPLPCKHLKPVVVEKSAIFPQIYPKKNCKVFYKNMFFHALFENVFLK
jgi:hypothetical protein